MTDPAERGVPTVADPIEIMARACFASDWPAEDWDIIPEYRREVYRWPHSISVRALEAAGFRIVSGEVGIASPEMIDAIEKYPGKGKSSFPDHFAEDVVRAFLARAPLHGKG